MIKSFHILILILLLSSFALAEEKNNDSMYTKNTFLLTLGTNMVYPLTDEHILKNESVIAHPQSSFNSPWINLNYSRTIFTLNQSYISYILGIGYTKNSLKSVVTGWYKITDYAGKTYIVNGPFNYEFTLYSIDTDIGFLSNVKLSKTLSWENQIFFSVNYYFQTSERANSNLEMGMDAFNIYNSWQYVINYKTGINVCLTKNLYVSPTILFPLFVCIKKNEYEL